MEEMNSQGGPAANHAGSIRVLLVADTHLGFDLPFRPRIKRRRRGHDFFANLDLALQPAQRGEVDLVVHGGDLFYRSKVPPALVEMALAPLVGVAEQGVPVYLVPGNHERSRIPRHLWARHPNLHIFEEPCTMVCALEQGSVALSGFPFQRRVGDRFQMLLHQTGYKAAAGEIGADVRLLCMHQTVEGAQVGLGNFTFRSGPDVIPGRAIPGDFHAVLAGHIHRAQVLSSDLAGHPLAAPVIYPGSVERTSFAEREEEKVFAIVSLGLADGAVDVSFEPLPARPMVSLAFEASEPDAGVLLQRLRSELQRLDPDAVVRVRLNGCHAAVVRPFLSAATLRKLAPATMNISLVRERRPAKETG